MVNNYVPKQKDIVLIDFNPTRGHEQGGYRPAVVISTDIFNKFTKMIMVCPITTNTKEFPTHYTLKETKKVKGAVLCEHIRSIDYEERKAKYIENMSVVDFENMMEIFHVCFQNIYVKTS